MLREVPGSGTLKGFCESQAMSLIRFIRSAIVGIAVAVLVLILGVAGEIAWFVLRLRESDESAVGGVFSWVSLPGAPALILAAVGLVSGFVWAFRRYPARRLRAPSRDTP
jgi:hypothetical protein